MTRSPERLWELAAELPRWGVTAWLPTVVTAPVGAVDAALAAAGRRARPTAGGARCPSGSTPRALPGRLRPGAPTREELLRPPTLDEAAGLVPGRRGRRGDAGPGAAAAPTR